MEDHYDRVMAGGHDPVVAGMFDDPLTTLRLKHPVMVAETATVRHAIDAMNAHKIGCVLVGDHRGVTGIFTERDILNRVTGRGVDHDNAPIGEYMTSRPETLLETDRIAHALNAMVTGGYRHVPIVKKDGTPVGVFSMRHCMELILEHYEDDIMNVPPPGMQLGGVQAEGA